MKAARLVAMLAVQMAALLAAYLVDPMDDHWVEQKVARSADLLVERTAAYWVE